jgi:3-oxoacyl-[acyl-carrier-protein] synthase II
VTPRRVAITGFGAVTPLGNDAETTWSALVAGTSGIRTIQTFDPERLNSRMAGEVRDLDPGLVLDRKETRRTDRFVHLALVATREAMDRAGRPARLEGAAAEETGAIIATGMGGNTTLFEQIAISTTRGPDRLSPFFIPMAIGNLGAGYVSIAFGAQGPNFATVSACASGGHAIGEAAEIILRGDAEVMLAGGTEAPIVEAIVGGFDAMRALSRRNDDPEAASRPFDAARDGFVIAEGAATLVLEEAGHAIRREAPILAELAGYGATADAAHITLPAAGGSGAVRATRRALQKAGLEPAAVDHVSAHATSTPEGDAAELAAFRTLFGAEEAASLTSGTLASRPAISAIKGAIGHTLGAAGAIASVAALLALRDGCIPPTLNLHDPDPRAGHLDCTPLVASERPVDIALVNAFGFGGHNTALILRRWEA